MVLTKRLRAGRARWIEAAALLLAMVPLGWLLWRLLGGAFVFDPVKEATIITGRWAIWLLLLTLAIRPVSQLLGRPGLLRFRRPLGLGSALYAGGHFLAFVGLDYQFDLALLGPAILDQPFVLVGTGAGLILLILALTSLASLRRRLGRHWKTIQRLTYLAGLLAVAHYLLLVKSPWEGWTYALALAVLLALRLVPLKRFGLSGVASE
jgi:sulfoxide reductase heme-binding subunit YedZ